MAPIDQLIQATRETRKRIAIIGCSISDEWVHGDLQPSQDGCMKFVEKRTLLTPGGAAGVARQLCRWNCEAALISLVKPEMNEAWNQVQLEYAQSCRRMPVKRRYLDEQGRIVFRHDLDNGYGLDANGIEEARRLSLLAIQEGVWDAVLISDYEKGFLTEGMIREAIRLCEERDVPIICDAKRKPEVYAGSVVKCNEEWRQRHHCTAMGANALISTRGSRAPYFFGPGPQPTLGFADGLAVECRNHVGAGDAFAAHLTLALAHGLFLDAAAQIAHAAGRVYVQHLHGRPAFPFEVRRDIDPVGGKVISRADLGALRQSIPGRIVVANGTFRAIHAGHAQMLQWAKAQGDVLVVCLNSDASVKRIKAGYCLPALERAALLAAMASVDWLIVYDEDDPCAVLAALKADLLCKGEEYRLCDVPGRDLVKEVRFAPMVEASRPARLIPA